MNYEEVKKMTKENIAKAVSGSSGLISAIEKRIENPEVLARIPIKELLGYVERLTGLAQKNLKIGGYLEGANYEIDEDDNIEKVEISDDLRERVRRLLGE